MYYTARKQWKSQHTYSALRYWWSTGRLFPLTTNAWRCVYICKFAKGYLCFSESTFQLIALPYAVVTTSANIIATGRMAINSWHLFYCIQNRNPWR